MSFKIDFSAAKPTRPINQNIHDEAAWACAHDWANANGWPLQYATHYIYELMNRPWLPDVQRVDEVATWMEQYQPNLRIKI